MGSDLRVQTGTVGCKSLDIDPKGSVERWSIGAAERPGTAARYVYKAQPRKSRYQVNQVVYYFLYEMGRRRDGYQNPIIRSGLGWSLKLLQRAANFGPGASIGSRCVEAWTRVLKLGVEAWSQEWRWEDEEAK